MGITIPTLCHYRGLSPYGACRVCLVEIDTAARTQLVASCSHPVEDGPGRAQRHGRVREARQTVLELLLAQAPRSPELAAFAAGLGVGRDAAGEGRRRVKCILCGSCVRPATS